MIIVKRRRRNHFGVKPVLLGVMAHLHILLATFIRGWGASVSDFSLLLLLLLILNFSSSSSSSSPSSSSSSSSSSSPNDHSRLPLFHYARILVIAVNNVTV